MNLLSINQNNHPSFKASATSLAKDTKELGQYTEKETFELLGHLGSMILKDKPKVTRKHKGVQNETRFVLMKKNTVTLTTLPWTANIKINEHGNRRKHIITIEREQGGEAGPDSVFDLIKTLIDNLKLRKSSKHKS